MADNPDEPAPPSLDGGKFREKYTETLARKGRLKSEAKRQGERSSEKKVSEAPPPQTADNAVRAYILLFALGFVLRGIDVMDHDMFDAIQKWAIAAVISTVDYFYVPVRTALGPRFTATASKVATDFRWWAASILVLLLWAAIAPAVEKHG